MKGLVYIFTGTEKGKTSAAIGMATRASCSGMKVAWVAWYKEASWEVSEYKMARLLPNFSMYIEGKGFFFADGEKIKRTKTGAVVDKASEKEHRMAATAALERAKEIMKESEVELLILDEVCQAAAEGLIEVSEVLELVERRGEIHLVLTGRNAPEALIEAADTVTEMKNIAHAFEKGISAVKGLDF